MENTDTCRCQSSAVDIGRLFPLRVNAQLEVAPIRSCNFTSVFDVPPLTFRFTSTLKITMFDLYTQFLPPGGSDQCGLAKIRTVRIILRSSPCAEQY